MKNGPMSSAAGARPWMSAGHLALVHASVAALLAGGPIVIAQSPRTAPDTRLAEASRALAAGDADRALQLGAAYLKQHPADAKARLLIARVHLHRHELDAAYVQLDRALRTDPRNVDVLYYLGLVTGQLAAVQFQRLIEEAPDSARVHQIKAETLEAQERRPEAEQEYEAALRASPNLLEALLGLGKLKRIRLDCDAAIELYQKAEKIRPTFDGAYGLGLCYAYLQNDEAASVQFGQALERNPKSAVACVGLGTALVRIGRAAEGIEKLQRAIAIEPGMDEAYYVLGLAYNATGDKVRAQEAFKKAEELRAARR
jgi:tetratricopeptide (TPR) repeat protein